MKMLTFKRLRSAGLIFALCMVAAAAAQAQALVEATILTTNVDVQNRKLYVEVNYTPKPCGDYQLRFKLQKPATGAPASYTAIRLDSVMTNSVANPLQYIDNFTFPSGDGYTGPEAGKTIKVLQLDNTAVGGYYLRFHLDSTVTSADQPTVCMETYKNAYRCKACGIQNSDLIFGEKSVAEGCKSEYTGGDMVWCQQRSGGANNWAGYIQDPRDCQVYRTVKMPDGKWWFAENLGYKEGLARTTLNNGDKAGVYFIPTVMGGTPTGTEADEHHLEVYGALYPWATARALDGGTTGSEGNVADEALPLNQTTGNTTKRGICPPDWFLPNDADWGIMLNYAEGCSGANATNPVSNLETMAGKPCGHFSTSAPTTGTTVVSTVMSVTTTGNVDTRLISDPGNMSSAATTQYRFELGSIAGRRLKSYRECPAPSNNCDNRVLNNYTANRVTQRWVSSTNVGLDWFGMDVRPAGFYHYSSSASNYYGRGQLAVFLSATNSGVNNNPVMRSFYNGTPTVRRFYFDGTEGGTNAYSVRCVRP